MKPLPATIVPFVRLLMARLRAVGRLAMEMPPKSAWMVPMFTRFAVLILILLFCAIIAPLLVTRGAVKLRLVVAAIIALDPLLTMDTPAVTFKAPALLMMPALNTLFTAMRLKVVIVMGDEIPGSPPLGIIVVSRAPC